MAQPGSLFDRYDLDDNVKESVSRMITNISPTETAFLSSISGSETTGNHKHEWLVDSLSAPAVNKHIDGDDFAADNLDNADRRANYLQISKKQIAISGRAQNSNTFGRLGTMKYEIMKAAKELKRDVNMSIQTRKVPVAGNNSTAADSAGFPAFLRSNWNAGATGVAPTVSSGLVATAGTDGTPRALKIDTVFDMVREVWDEGGKVDCIFLDSELKAAVSKYLFKSNDSRIAEQQQDQGKKGVTGGAIVQASVAVLITEFGQVSLMVDRQIPSGTGAGQNPHSELFLVDKDKLKMAYFKGRKYIMEKIAKSGDSMKRHLLVDYCLMVMDEKAHAVITDINNTAAVTE